MNRYSRRLVLLVAVTVMTCVMQAAPWCEAAAARASCCCHGSQPMTDCGMSACHTAEAERTAPVMHDQPFLGQLLAPQFSALWAPASSSALYASHQPRSQPDTYLLNCTFRL